MVNFGIYYNLPLLDLPTFRKVDESVYTSSSVLPSSVTTFSWTFSSCGVLSRKTFFDEASTEVPRACLSSSTFETPNYNIIQSSNKHRAHEKWNLKTNILKKYTVYSMSCLSAFSVLSSDVTKTLNCIHKENCLNLTWESNDLIVVPPLFLDHSWPVLGQYYLLPNPYLFSFTTLFPFFRRYISSAVTIVSLNNHKTNQPTNLLCN
jgi:hypothetical protein